MVKRACALEGEAEKAETIQAGEGKVQRDLINVHKQLMGGYKEVGGQATHLQRFLPTHLFYDPEGESKSNF